MMKLVCAATARTSKRLLSSTKRRYSLPDLPYEFGALEPHISGEIMQLHHDKHHAAYVSNLNKATENMEDAMSQQDLTKVLSLQKLIKFNGGGHINHSIFWKNLAPVGKGGGEMPTGELSAMIECQFGSLENLKTVMSDQCNSVQGSGWVWLAYDKITKRLAVTTTKNQTPLEAKTGLVPLLGIDVWEHAFYLQYKNARAEYVKNIWNVVHWKDVCDRLCAAAVDAEGSGGMKL